MKIEKKKITGTKQFSIAAKSALAASLGMMAAFTLNACDDSSSANSDPTPASSSEESQPSSSSVKAASDSSAPAETKQDSAEQTGAQQSSSEQKEATQNNSEQTETQQSSSSQVVDIPLSHEPISSSVMEALSAAAESSSTTAKPDTSAAASEFSSSIPQPASSSVVPSSSSTPASSSSYNGWGPYTPNPCQGHAPGDSVLYETQIIICPTSSTSTFLPGSGMSMVITFEKTDIEV
jgi:hypothetical protein